MGNVQIPRKAYAQFICDWLGRNILIGNEGDYKFFLNTGEKLYITNENESKNFMEITLYPAAPVRRHRLKASFYFNTKNQTLCRGIITLPNNEEFSFIKHDIKLFRYCLKNTMGDLTKHYFVSFKDLERNFFDWYSKCS